MTDLFQLAGAGSPSPGGIIKDIGRTLGPLSLPLMFLPGIGPLLGGGTALGSGIASLVGGITHRNAQRTEGKKRFDLAQIELNKELKNNSDLYSNENVKKYFNRMRSSLSDSHTNQTNQLLDRYSSVQRRLLKNKIKSGLTSGAAQAQSIQNNINSQYQANNLFENQGQSLIKLNLLEQQRIDSSRDKIGARLREAKRSVLLNQGIIDPAAIGGLTKRLGGL